MYLHVRGILDSTPVWWPSWIANHFFNFMKALGPNILLPSLKPIALNLSDLIVKVRGTYNLAVVAILDCGPSMPLIF